VTHLGHPSFFFTLIVHSFSMFFTWICLIPPVSISKLFFAMSDQHVPISITVFLPYALFSASLVVASVLSSPFMTFFYTFRNFLWFFGYCRRRLCLFPMCYLDHMPAPSPQSPFAARFFLAVRRSPLLQLDLLSGGNPQGCFENSSVRFPFFPLVVCGALSPPLVKVPPLTNSSREPLWFLLRPFFHLSMTSPRPFHR